MKNKLKQMNDNQCTIRNPLSLEGKGLHFGHRIQVTLKPATVDQGLTVCIDNNKIPLRHQFLDHKSLYRRTVIQKGKYRINTIEHLLAALHGLGIDNMDIILSSEDLIPHDEWEMPLLDGSSRQYCDALLKADIKKQETPRRYYSYPHDVHFTFENSSFTYVPWQKNRLVITTTLLHPHFLIDVQTLSLVITPGTFYDELSAARTFCRIEEVEFLKNKGLIKGGSLKEALVLGEESYINTSLHYQDEPVRHKMLDFLGDLKLMGKNLKGHIMVVSGGHRSHCAFLNKLINLEADYVAKKTTANRL